MTYGIGVKKCTQGKKRNQSFDRVSTEEALIPFHQERRYLMTTSQQTSSLLDQMRESGPDECVEAGVAVQDTSRSVLDDPMTGHNGIKDDTAKMIIQPRRAHRQFAYPEWPTSKPGPQETLPLSGQKPHSLRTDQMVCEYYDQERGLPCVPSPAPIVPKWQRKGTPHPKIDVREDVSSAEAIERWLDDGGTSDNRST